jgi:hypothetical protein
MIYRCLFHQGMTVWELEHLKRHLQGSDKSSTGASWPSVKLGPYLKNSGHHMVSPGEEPETRGSESVKFVEHLVWVILFLCTTGPRGCSFAFRSTQVGCRHKCNDCSGSDRGNRLPAAATVRTGDKTYDLNLFSKYIFCNCIISAFQL